jgi:hypothetical protein
MKTSFEMGQKVLNEEQMREYVEQEVRKALMNEEIDEGILNWLGKLVGGDGQNGNPNWLGILDKLPGFSWETLIGAVLGRVAVAPILVKLLTSLGIPADSAFGKFVVNTAVTAGGAYLGDWIDKNHNLIGGSNGPDSSTSLGGGAGFSGGGAGGGSR